MNVEMEDAEKSLEKNSDGDCRLNRDDRKDTTRIKIEWIEAGSEKEIEIQIGKSNEIDFDMHITFEI